MLSFSVTVALLSTVIQREAQPYLDPWLASLVYLCHWLINMCCISIVLVESEMITDADSILVGVLMLIFVSQSALLLPLSSKGYSRHAFRLTSLPPSRIWYSCSRSSSTPVLGSHESSRPRR